MSTTTKLDRLAERIRGFRLMADQPVAFQSDLKAILEILEDMVEEMQRIDRAVNHK